MATFFNLAHGTKPLEYSNSFPWPYDIDICFDDVRHPVAFSEGVGHGAAGCAVSASAALEPQWREHFVLTNGDWLLPYIEQLSLGYPLPREEILLKYRTLHQKEPESYESKFA